MKKVLIRATALGLLPLLGAGADAATNLVQNGSFSENTLPTLNPADASGAEIDSLWNYNGDLTDWSSVAPQVYNILFTGTLAADTSINADTRYTADEAQHLNSNVTSLSPDGGAFVGLDGDPGFSGPLTQTINGLTVGDTYLLLGGRRAFQPHRLPDSPVDWQLRRRLIRHAGLHQHKSRRHAGLVFRLDPRDLRFHRQCDERTLVVPRGRDARIQPAAFRPS
jgi:hypothetical protein